MRKIKYEITFVVDTLVSVVYSIIHQLQHTTRALTFTTKFSITNKIRATSVGFSNSSKHFPLKWFEYLLLYKEKPSPWGNLIPSKSVAKSAGGGNTSKVPRPSSSHTCPEAKT